MKNIFRKKDKKGTLVIIQIIILVLSTIAFAYIIGSEIPVVSADPTQCIRSTSRGVISAPNINLNDQNAVNQWCSISTNRADVCNGGSGSDWHIRFAASCPSPPTPSALTLPSALQFPPLGNFASRVLGGGGAATTEAGTTAGAAGASAGSGIPPLPPGFGSYNDVANAGYTPPINLANLANVKWIVSNAAYAAVIYVGVRFIFQQFGLTPELGRAVANGASIGYFVGAVVSKVGLSGKLGALLGISGGLATLGIGVIVGIIVFLFTFKNTRYNNYTFTCYPWDAPLGGKNCQQCNTGNFPCTEYACRSLGQGCILANQGTNETLCVWNNSRDVTPPVIQPWIDVLTTGYKYTPDNAISPPDRGVTIVPQDNNSGCIKAFTPLTFGITLDKPAKCQLNTVNQASFGDGTAFYFNGSSTSKMNHSQTMTLPSLQSLEAANATLQNGGQFTLYAKCQDANGNANTANFVFKFCVNPGPDLTPPNITTTSILNGMPIAFNTTSVNLDVFINKPSTCRWSQTDQSYDTMETNMSCSSNVFEVNAQGLYKCSTTLTGLISGVNNIFYFRCKDQPYLEGTNQSSQRNVNTQSYKFTLKGTQPLVISSVGPNATTIKNSTDVIKVTLNATTSAGFNEGASLCSYNGSGTNNQFIQFFNTGTYKHSQDLFLTPGDYTYNIQCIDLGGNTDTKTMSFTVQSDKQAPIVVRAYHEGTYLKIVTDKKATCVYSTSQDGCNYLFKDGISMQSLDINVNQISWDPAKTFYIKCKDDFGNQPLPNECSIIASPYSIK